MLKKADIILAVILIALGFVPLIAFAGSGGGTVTVTHNGKTVYSGSLNEDKTIEVDGRYHNTIRISGGSVSFVKSDCPNRDCVDAGSHTSGVIACAPNGVIVTVSGAKTGGSGVDTLAE